MTQEVQLHPGDLFSDRYEVIDFVTEGERRRTYLARDLKLGRKVALSVVRSKYLVVDPDGVEREAKVLASVASHDSIVSVFDFETGGPVQFVVFEYMSGGTLADYISRVGPLRLEDLLRYGRQVCRGLAHLHANGLVHRDVSPRNVLLDDRGEAHLGDFDSAIKIGDAGSADIPTTANPLAAPEEREGSHIDLRADLYSFGWLLYVMALGTDCTGEVAELRIKRPDLPSSFADLVENLLADSPAGRPADAETVLSWLDEIRNASNIEALVREGESQQIEFKASLRHLYGPIPEQMQTLTRQEAERLLIRELEVEVTKTIAAFLNTDGGMLLIGVRDNGQIVGIEDDLRYIAGHSTDKWQLMLQRLIISDLGEGTFSSIRIHLVQHGDVHVAVVSCPRRSSETWHGKEEAFYVRAGNGTRQLTGRNLLTYIREHW